MGNIKRPAPAKLICSILAAGVGLLDEARAALIARYGPADFVSAPMPFHHTTYYAEEMGSDLLRQIIAFETLIDPGILPDVKIATNEMEERWMIAGRRRVNLDPG